MLIFFNFREMHLKENLFKNAYFFNITEMHLKGVALYFNNACKLTICMRRQ